MVKEICRDTFFLAQKSLPAGKEDIPIGRDLLETLEYNADRCVGMAANMIGCARRIIVFSEDGRLQLMYNPRIIKKEGPYEAEEGCLSLTGTRKTTRYQVIKVEYQNEAMQTRLKTYRGWTAQIIQHEVDHLDGILI